MDLELSHQNLFLNANWIWTHSNNVHEYVLFRKQIELKGSLKEKLIILITASYYYELFINGQFVSRGPVYGDSQWCHYDELEYSLSPQSKMIEIVIIVHHSEARIASVLSAPGGLIAEFHIGEYVFGTDNSWQYLDLPMWQRNAPKRGWALGPCESYNAMLEPNGWQKKTFTNDFIKNWQYAEIIENAATVWTNYARRMTPSLERKNVIPKKFKTFRTKNNNTDCEISSLSRIHDSELLEELTDFVNFNIDEVNLALKEANCLSFDFGSESIGHFCFEIEADENAIIEVSGAERLRNGRPWIAPREEQYSIRYICREGKQKYISFLWSGFRYLHFIIRNRAKVKISYIACTTKAALIKPIVHFNSEDNELQSIFDICMHTLCISAQEHLVDCPSREQLQYWGDAVFIAQSLWHAFGEESYLRWYLECFIHCPLSHNGLISSVYPGDHDGWTLLDYTLIPVIGQQFYKTNKGEFYKPKQFFARAMQLNEWFNKHKNIQGLIDFDLNEYIQKEKIRIFIDHPGIGWHNFPHPGIDRKGVSCPLNMFYYNFICVLSIIADEIKKEDVHIQLSDEAQRLQDTIIKRFYDGRVFHDAIDNDIISTGTSWQTNALAVCFNLIEGVRAKIAMEYIIENYDKLCRCSPYFYFYLLPAMEKVSMQPQALELIKIEWGNMIKHGATTTWETFSGDERDSLCHPWSTAPILFLLNKSIF